MRTMEPALVGGGIDQRRASMSVEPAALSRQRWLILLLIGSVLVAAAALMVWLLDIVEEERDRGPSKAALRNPFLASQRLLSEYQIPFRQVQGFSGIDTMRWPEQPAVGQYDTLVLINAYHNLHQRQVERLWQWVANGGRLLIAVENPYIGSGEPDPLLERLGLTLMASADGDEEPPVAAADSGSGSILDDAPEAGDPDEFPFIDNPLAEPITTGSAPLSAPQEVIIDPCQWSQARVTAQLHSDEPELDLGVSWTSHFTVDTEHSRILAGESHAAYLVQQTWGRGELYAITSALAWRNSHIGCTDNAYLFWRLVKDSPQVWYAINEDSPSFWRLVWQLSPVGASATLLALGFWLWTQATRFGPVMQQPRQGRRQFIDHIRAAAQFTLRQRGSAALVELLRQDLMQTLQLRQPGFNQRPPTEQILTLHAISDMPTAAIDAALFQPLPMTDTQFLDVVKSLQQLRNRL